MVEASPKRKTFVLISVIIGLVCTAVVLLGMWSIIDGSVLDIPLVRMIAPADEMEAAEEQFEEFFDRIEDASDDEIDEFEDETGVSVKEAKRFFKSPSLNGMISLADKIPALGADEEVVAVFSIMRIIAVVYSIIIALFTLLAALLKKKAFSIVALCVGLLFFALLANVIWTVLFLLLCIAHIVFISLANHA